MNPEQSLDKSLSAAATVDADKSRGRLRGIWLFLAIFLPVVAFLAAGAYGIDQVVNNSDLCVKCHEMRPEYYTWLASSHSQIKCTDCHMPVDPWQGAIRYTQGLRMIVTHFTNTYQLPLATKQPIGNDVCLKCHSQNRIPTIPGDLIISHTTHDAAGVQCINCHNGAVHARIVERDEITKVPMQDWTPTTGRIQMEVNNTEPRMLQCLTCHRKWKVTTQCEKCHKKTPTPPSHQPATWRTMHGQAAWKDVNLCSQCHYEKGLSDSFDKQEVADYIRSNSFCYNCHLKTKPPDHIYTWAHDHSTHVVKGEVPYCIVCHDLDPPKNGQPTKGNPIYCNMCHGQYYVGPNKIERIELPTTGQTATGQTVSGQTVEKTD